MQPNFTLQDIFGSLLAVLIYPLVFVIPGYVIGWLLDLFDFRKRLPLVRFVIAIVLSNAASPILLFLISRFISLDFAITLLFIIAFIWIVILIFSHRRDKAAGTPFFSPKNKRYQIIALATAGIWTILSILWLVDLQFGDKLYFNAVSYDYTTRVAVVDAITRTGVPPVNPGYFPGQPVKLTFLYYFWYILGSVVDKIGGDWVSAYQAMIASIAWIGLCLMATLALYLRLRNANRQVNPWRTSLLASQLILVSGLDFIPVIMLIINSRLSLGFALFNGRIEGWNMPIMSWMNALTWVPNHVSGALACLTGMLLFIHAMKNGRKQILLATLLTGLAFASTVGLTVWIMFTFGIFWGIWMIALASKKETRGLIWYMMLAGILALVFASPFLAGIIQPGSSGGSAGGLPIAFYIRPFTISAFLPFLPPLAINLLNLVFLPFNYLFELGFFFALALLWLQTRRNKGWENNPYFIAESLLVLTITILLSFVYSNLIAINDLGIRGWIPLQFMLIIWTVDVLEKRLGERILLTPSVFRRFPGSASLATLLTILFTVGIATSLLEITITRTWPLLTDFNIPGFPNELSPDTQLGRRTSAARLAYNYIRDTLPPDAIIQSNPTVVLDRPGGLYGTRQVAIADRTAYGVPADIFKSLAEQVGEIFETKNITGWESIDQNCRRHFINAIITNDTDPLWQSLPNLAQQRSPLYQNQFYAIFGCGDFANFTP